MSENRSKIGPKLVPKSVQNWSQNRSKIEPVGAPKKHRKSSTLGDRKSGHLSNGMRVFGTCLSMGTGSALKVLHLVKLRKHVRASVDMVEREQTRAIMCMHERT